MDGQTRTEIKEEIRSLKSQISACKEICKKADVPIKEKLQENLKIQDLKSKIAELEKVRPINKTRKMSETQKTEKAPKKVKEDVQIDGKYFADGTARMRSEVFADEALKEEYQKARKKERKQLRAAAKKAEAPVAE